MSRKTPASNSSGIAGIPTLAVAVVILLLLAGAWYWHSKKTAKSASSGSDAKSDSAGSATSSSAATGTSYRVTGNISFGKSFLVDGKGNSIPVQNFAPKIGDIVSGPVVHARTFNNNPDAPMGINYSIQIPGAGIGGQTIFFIPLTDLTPIS